MSNIIATVRLPKKLKQQAEYLVKKGYFKNLSDALITGLRREVRECMTLESVKNAKEQVWQEYLSKAGGDPEKASKLYLEDAKKYQKEHPEFFKL